MKCNGGYEPIGMKYDIDVDFEVFKELQRLRKYPEETDNEIIKRLLAQNKSDTSPSDEIVEE